MGGAQVSYEEFEEAFLEKTRVGGGRARGAERGRVG